MNPDLTNALLSITFGAIAGGVTNAVAVWMLFHPYESPTLLGWRLRFLQGAVPKNKVRLAAAIGKTVGTKLLTPEDLARTLTEPSFRAAFDERLRKLVRALLDQERGTLMDILPVTIHDEVRGLIGQVSDSMVARFDAYVDTDEFRTAVRSWAATLAEEIADQPLGENLLTPEREAAIIGTASRWIEELVDSPGFGTALHDYLDRGAVRLLAPGRTFQDVLPQGMVAALERAIASYLPIAIERLGGMLDDPGARARVEKVLHELLDRFMADLRFHQRLVAALLITPETVDKVLRAIEKDGASKIAELFQDNDVRDAMARGVNSAIVDFLGKDVRSVLGQPGDPTVESAKAAVANWVITLARDDQTRRFLVEKLVSMLNAAEDRTWGDIFRHVPPEKLADALVKLARSERAHEVYREAADRLIEGLLNRRVGRVADYLPPDSADRMESALAEPVWNWIEVEVPQIAQRIDIARRVEQKILDFPTAQVEQLIRNVTQRELNLIVNLGYVLGAMIGAISATIGLIF